MRHIVILTYACFAVWMFFFFSTLMVIFQLGSLTHTGMDYLYFRRKFTWTDEDSLISWYNHLRWGFSGNQDLQRTFQVLHCDWRRACPVCGFTFARSQLPPPRHEHRHHRSALPGDQVPHLLLCCRQEPNLLGHRLLYPTTYKHSTPQKLNDQACWSR